MWNVEENSRHILLLLVSSLFHLTIPRVYKIKDWSYFLVFLFLYCCSSTSWLLYNVFSSVFFSLLSPHFSPFHKGWYDLSASAILVMFLGLINSQINFAFSSKCMALFYNTIVKKKRMKKWSVHAQMSYSFFLAWWWFIKHAMGRL